jgi:peptidoglycan/xylan/chitin deacetylase (PgdA/CDA1 family)/tetratricopeptide (TPR) repeat protein
MSSIDAKRIRWTGTVALMLGVTAATGAQGQTVTPADQAATALHLLEGARYGEAIPAAQALVSMAPNDALSYQIRGTVELYVGGVDAAQEDFDTAQGLLPDCAATLYGQGITQLWTRHWDAVQTDLSQAQQVQGLSVDQTNDLATALAYLGFLRGAGEASPSSLDGKDLVRQELLALAAAQKTPQEGITLLTAFLTTPSGVPRVREDEGLRPTFDPAVNAVEPSVTEPSLQHMFAASLREIRAQADRQAKATHPVSGIVTLSGPPHTSSTVAAVTFTIDGKMAGMTNTPPFYYHWDTASGGNGRHAIRIDVLDQNGVVVSTTMRTLYVSNPHPGVSDAGLAADPGLETRVWNLLRLRPSRKVAEWTLAELAEQQGDHTSAQAHRIVAAALDADYKDGRHIARTIFGGSSPKAQLAAKGDSLPGLTSGSPSRKWVALTFDDGPDPQHTPALLDALDKADVPATFFVVGARAEESPDLIRRMVALGDDVEDHSYTHPNMAQTAAPIAESEILRTSVVIRALTGKQPRFFRPPGGQRNPVVYHLAGLYGQTVALWTIDALNYEEAGSPQGLIDFIMKHMQPGAIVLMHNGMSGTAAAVPGLAAALRAKGYQMVTLSQMVSGTSPVHAASASGPGLKSVDSKTP